MKIGVFDSGSGGLSVTYAVRRELPELEVIYREDKENLPYGTKSPETLLKLVTPILEEMVRDGCKVIVIACNTVTTNIITELRARIKVPLVGTEPMVKPAAEQTKTGVVAVFATPATLKSKRYAYLKETYAPDVKVLEPDCSDWALMVETNSLDMQHVKNTVQSVIDGGADVLVLGCTHYHWIEKIIQNLAGDWAKVIQPEEALVRRLKTVLTEL